MGIDYKFNTWRVSGEQAKTLSPRVYNLLRLNTFSDSHSGWRVGAILYLHHVKGLTATEIKKSLVGSRLPLQSVKSLINGINNKNVNPEIIEACQLFYKMLKDEPEMLERLYEPVI